MGNQPLVCMNNGRKIPMIGLGTWQTESEADVVRALESAFKVGYRHIDTATFYKNEEVIGRVVKDHIQRGLLKREELFITTKIWPTHLHPDRQEDSLRESLRKLQVDYVDLVLAHMPTVYELDGTHDSSVSVEDIWRGLQTLHRKGLAASIGVSNWSIDQMQRIINLKEDPINVAQVECHLYWPQHELVEFCKKNRIIVTAYGSLGSPGRVNFGAEEGMKWINSPNPFEEEAVKVLAARYHKTPAQILLRWAVDRGIVVIPKSSNAKRIAENLDIVDIHLAEDEVELLNNTKYRQRLFTGDQMIGHPEDGFKSERLSK